MPRQSIDEFLEAALAEAKSKYVRKWVQGFIDQLALMRRRPVISQQGMAEWSKTVRRSVRYRLSQDDSYARAEREGVRMPATHNDPADDPELAEREHWWFRD